MTNGMSLAARDGVNANAGLLANVFPSDLPGDDPLAGVELQRRCEQRAYELGGGDFRAPAQLVGDFLAHRPSEGPRAVLPTYPRGVAWGEVDDCLPAYVRDALRAGLPLLARKLPCYGEGDAVLTGVESRSSSPVRVTRGDDLRSLSCAGLWPSASAWRPRWQTPAAGNRFNSLRHRHRRPRASHVSGRPTPLQRDYLNKS